MHPTAPSSPATHHPVGAWTALRTLRRLAAAVLCLVTSLCQQAQANGLDVTDGFKPSVKFTETLQEVAAPSTPEGVRTLTTSTLTLVANLEGADASFNPSTPVSLALGNFNFSRTLGDDPAYHPSKTSVVFALGVDGAGNPDASKAFLRVSWTSTRLTLTLTLGQAAVDAPAVLMADQQYGQPASPKLYLTSLCRFSFANVEGERTLYVTGSHAIQNTTIGGTPVELNTVKLSGVFDVTPPVINLGQLKSGMMVDDTTPPFAITATDAITLGDPDTTLQIRIGRGPNTMAVWNEGPLTIQTPGGWGLPRVGGSDLFDLSPLPDGRIFIQIRAQDLGGNVTTTLIPVYKRFPAGVAGRWEGGIGENFGAISFIVDQRGYVLSGRLRFPELTDHEEYTSSVFRSIPFSGFFMGSPQGFLIPRRGTSPLRLFIASPAYNEAEGDYTCAATLIESTEDTAYLDWPGGQGVYRTPYSTRNPAPEHLRGRFHFGYITRPRFPYFGHGFTALNRSPSGSVVFTGRVPDGTPYTGSLAMGPRGQVTMIAPLYGGKGFVKWRPTPTDMDVTDLYGEWLRPESLASPTWPWGMHDVQRGDGKRYIPPTAGQNFLGQTTLSPTLTSGWTMPVVRSPIDWMGVVIPEIPLTFTTTSLTQGVGQAPNHTSARITHMDRATGIITGSFYIHGYVGWSPLATFRAQIVGNEALGYYISNSPHAQAPNLIGAIRFYTPK